MRASRRYSAQATLLSLLRGAEAHTGAIHSVAIVQDTSVLDAAGAARRAAQEALRRVQCVASAVSPHMYSPAPRSPVLGG